MRYIFLYLKRFWQPDRLHIVALFTTLDPKSKHGGGLIGRRKVVRRHGGVYAENMVRGESTKNLSKNKWDTTGVLLDESAAAGPVDLREIFGNDRPVEVEIGSGKGAFVLARAASRPDVNILGIEYAAAYCRYAADRVRRAGLNNVRMLIADAADFFRTCLGDECIRRIHIYFPDPWPKRRHHKRRLITPQFVAGARRTLTPGGMLLIVTDHMEYYRWIRRVLADAGGMARVPFPAMSDEAGELVGTNFERKYIAQGRNFYAEARMKYAK